MVEEDERFLGVRRSERINNISSNLSNLTTEFSNIKKEIELFRRMVDEEITNSSVHQRKLGPFLYPRRLIERLQDGRRIIDTIDNRVDNMKVFIKNAEHTLMRDDYQSGEIPEE